MNIPEDIINRITIPTDLEEKFMYHSKRLTAAALNHTVQDGAQRSKKKKNGEVILKFTSGTQVLRWIFRTALITLR